jgi:sec-independent protein translocase protein TatA
MFTAVCSSLTTLGFITPGWSEMLILGFIALLLFGKRLPEVARSLGQGFVEFKKGMQTIDTDVRQAVYSDPPAKQNPNRAPRIEADLRPTAEKFEIPDEAETDSEEPENS